MRNIDKNGRMASVFGDQTALFIILAGLAVRSLAAALIPPGFDEAYYGIYPWHLAWGYFDHPPAVAITAGLGQWLTGSRSAISLRLGAIFLFTLSSLLLYQICQQLHGRAAGRAALSLFHIIPYFSIGIGAFVFPDNALIFFWLLCIYCLLQFQKTQKDMYLLACGVSIGFALLSKYHAVLLILAIGCLMIFYPEWRTLWKRPASYLAMFIALVIFLPNLIWNARHDWISYTYQFGKGTSGLKFSVSDFTQAILIQAVYLLPWILFLLWMGAIKAYKNRNREINWLIPITVFPIFVFTLIGATRPILPHWPMPGYIGAIILSSGWIAGWNPVRKRWLGWGTAGILLLLIGFLAIQSLSGIVRMPLKSDLTLDGQGWPELIDHIEKQQYFPDEDLFLFSHKWFTGGELAYAAGKEHTVTVFNRKAPNAFPFWVRERELIGRDGLFISSNRYAADPQKLYGMFFSRIDSLDQLQTWRGRRPAKLFTIWHCQNYQGGFPFPYGESEQK